MKFITNERGTATILGYILALAITSLLIVVMFIGTGQYIDEQREEVVSSQATVTGQRLAANVERLDRNTRNAGVQCPASATYGINVDLLESFAGENYELAVRQDPVRADTYFVRLTTRDPSTQTVVSFRSETIVRGATLNGGDVNLLFIDNSGTCEIQIS